MQGQAQCLHSARLAWQRGAITNFDYLLFCNLAAGRSFNDLTQWPVFPWVLSDYTSRSLRLGDPACFRDLSRPVGALNEQRLQLLRQRFRDMAAQGAVWCLLLTALPDRDVSGGTCEPFEPMASDWHVSSRASHAIQGLRLLWVSWQMCLGLLVRQTA